MELLQVSIRTGRIIVTAVINFQGTSLEAIIGKLGSFRIADLDAGFSEQPATHQSNRKEIIRIKPFSSYKTRLSAKIQSNSPLACVLSKTD
tara:strand:- start:313 stop:585 length:273 start_codon:yes stop_codon:yes gene_type:complete